MRPLYLVASFCVGCFFFLSSCGESSGGDDGGPMDLCGNGVVDPGEECDDGNDAAGDGCEACVSTATCGDDLVQGSEECEPSSDTDCFAVGHVDECTVPRTAFRWNHFNLVDPHIYDIDSTPNGCDDGFIYSTLQTALGTATRGDKTSLGTPVTALNGLVDLGFVLTFPSVNQGNGETSDVDFIISDCNILTTDQSFPGGPTPCSPTVTNPPSTVPFQVTTRTSGSCLEAVPDTTSFPASENLIVEAGDHGCFVNEEGFEMTVSLGSVVSFPLTDVKMAAQWNASPATELINGWFYGFLSEADADLAIIELEFFINGQTLTETLSPSDDCNHRDDRNGVEGWWVYFPWAAEEVPWKGGGMCGDGGDLDTDVIIGSVERDEVCDPGMSSGEDQCAPLVECNQEGVALLCLDECDDGFICTEDIANVGDPCAPKCFHRGIAADDGCCALLAPEENSVPSLENSDPDCTALCGDGTRQDWEVCDPADAENPCNPADCGDDDLCTRDYWSFANGNEPSNVCTRCTGDTCICQNDEITEADDGTDGCCPEGSPAGDPDCVI